MTDMHAAQDHAAEIRAYCNNHFGPNITNDIMTPVLALAADRDALGARVAALEAREERTGSLVAAFHELMEHVPATDEPGEPAFSIAVDYGVDDIIFPPHCIDDDGDGAEGGR